LTRHTRLDAVILDYNGVIGQQPTRSQWLRLARTASWPDDDLTGFQRAFWSAREPYDAGQLSDMAYWARVLGSHPGPRLLRELLTADTDM
jgi:putative hydrolase of the HAD superfamily